MQEKKAILFLCSYMLRYIRKGMSEGFSCWGLVI